MDKWTRSHTATNSVFAKKEYIWLGCVHVPPRTPLVTSCAVSVRLRGADLCLRVILGKKEHSSDQWWEKAFDNQLKNLDVSGGGASGEVTVKQTAPISTAIGMEKMAKYYIRFVKGGILEGEVEKMVKEVEEIPEDISTASEAERKLQRKKEKRARKEKKCKRDKKRKTGAVKEESKEERRERKRLKRLVQKELELLKIGK